VKIDKIIAEERMLAVERQVHAIVPKGAERVILCPYANQRTCRTFHSAVRRCAMRL